MIREMLADVDCEIAEAGDSREALRVIADRDVDVVVTDLEQTPGGGFELVWGLRGLPVNRQRPEVIVWSAHVDAPAIASRPEKREIAVALKRADNVDRLLSAIQAVPDDPLAFIEILED